MSDKPFGIIYRALFPNGKCYVGQTVKTLGHRINQHMGRLGDNSAFHNAIAKYGMDNIVWKVIDTADGIEELNKKEVFYIDFYNSFIGDNQGYNMTLGGEGSVGYVHSEETRAKMMGKKNALGCVHTNEQNEAKSLRMMGNVMGVGNTNAAGKRTAEQRAKMSAAHNGKGAGQSNPMSRTNINKRAALKLTININICESEKE